MKKLKYCGIAIAVFLVFFMIQFIVTGIFTVSDVLVVMSKNPGVTYTECQEKAVNLVYSQSTVITLIADAVAILVAFLAFGLGGKKFYQQVGLLKIKPYYIPIMLLMGLSANIVLALLIEILPIPDEVINQYIESSQTIDTSITFLNVFATAVIAPIAEEIIFRGLIFTRFSKAFGVVAGSILSSVIFGVAHGNLLWAIYAGLFGLLLAWSFYLTKSLVASICMHMAFNLSGFLLTEVNGFLAVVSFAVFFTCLAAIILLPKVRTGKDDQ